ncbi:hypothetical protein D3C72_2300700 [compost metagenome]
MPGLGRQGANLIGDHGKATTLLAGAGRFNGGVKCQQVGLFGNRADHFSGEHDVLGLPGQVGDRLVDLADSIGQ